MKRHSWDSVLALLAGGMYVLGFAPVAIRPFAIIAMAVFFALLSRQSAHKAARRSALTGLCFGLGMFGAGVSWVYVSMVNFGNMSALPAVAAVVIFVVLMALYPMLFALLSATLGARLSTGWRLLLVMPALWTLFEGLRGWLFTGFPWLLLGYAGLDTPLAGWAPVAGVMGMSFLLAMISSAVVLLVTRRQTWLPLGVIAAVFLSGWGLSQLKWSTPTGDAIKVATVQNNVAIQDKWNHEKFVEIQQAYWQASEWLQADLIVWAEGAMPRRLRHIDPAYLRALAELDGALAFGVPEVVEMGDKASVYNSIVLLDEAANASASVEQQPLSYQYYRKVHLVPFGEFFPLQWLLGGLFETLQIPMSNFSPWRAEQPPFYVKQVKLLPSICYEAAFPEVWRSSVKDTGILLNVSEDAWFGDSLAPHQRLEMARFRALEMARPMVRVSNTGLSAFIDYRGKVEKISPQFASDVLEHEVAARSGLTPYARWGRWPLYGLLLGLTGLALLVSRARE